MERCIDDMRNAVSRGRMILDEQSRAYDMLDYLMGGGYADSAAAFCREYEILKDRLADVYDEVALSEEAGQVLAPLQKELEDLRFAAASAASLHEFAKEVFDIWQTQGIFARKRALKELRSRAGFRLESHRIGNYVAKTFDLMNEAQTRFAHAQQALFAADVRYKIRPGVYARIYEVLTDKKK